MHSFRGEDPPKPTTPPFDWIEAIHASTLQMDDIPLFGGPPFPWEELSERLAALFKMPISLSAHPFSWKEEKALQEGLGETAQWVAVQIEGFPGELYWGMSKEALQAFSCHLLLQKENEGLLVDDDMSEGFFRFLLLGVFQILQELRFPAECRLLLGKAPEGLHAALASAVEVRWQGEQHFTGHVIITDPLRRAWRDHHAATPSCHTLPHVEVVMHVQAGKVQLTQSEWDSIGLGDYLLLDQCSLNPETQEGRVAVYLEDLCLLQGNLTGSTIVLTDQKDSTMHDDEDDFGDFEDLEDDFEDENHNDDEVSEEEDDDLESDSADDDEDDEFSFDEDYFEGETAADRFEHSEEKEHKAPARDNALPQRATPPQPIAQAPGAIEKLKLQEMPLKLSVEVAKLRMEVGKLLDLQPGNLLDLGTRPTDGVYLTHRGKRIAKGELVRAGERLALRIVEL